MFGACTHNYLYVKVFLRLVAGLMITFLYRFSIMVQLSIRTQKQG